MGVKLRNYLGFMILLFIVLFTFFIIFYEPHNYTNVIDYDKEFEIEERGESNFDDIDKVSGYVFNFYGELQGDIDRLKKNNELKDEQHEEMGNLLDEAWNRYISYTSDTSSNKNLSLYHSLWYIQKVKFFIDYYPLKNCVDDSVKIISNYKPFFYFIRQQDIDTIKYLKERVNGYIYRINKDRPDNIPRLKSDAERVWDLYYEFDKDNRKCKEFNEYISKDYQNQKNLFIIKYILVVVSCLIIFSFGKFLTLNLIKKTLNYLIKVFTNFGKFSNEIFKPKEVKIETIKQILKLSSLATTIVAITALFMNSIGLKDWFFFIIPILCVISLLLSILFGIISINSSNEKDRSVSYVLFIFGLILFIAFIFEIIFIFSFKSLTDMVKQSVITFFTNSTSV